MTPAPKRRWPQFTLAGLLLMVWTVALELWIGPMVLEFIESASALKTQAHLGVKVHPLQLSLALRGWSNRQELSRPAHRTGLGSISH